MDFRLVPDQDPDDIARARNIISEHKLDAVVSTDGDGDRPLVIDGTGRQMLGGKRVAMHIQAESCGREVGFPKETASGRVVGTEKEQCRIAEHRIFKLLGGEDLYSAAKRLEKRGVNGGV